MIQTIWDDVGLLIVLILAAAVVFTVLGLIVGSVVLALQVVWRLLCKLPEPTARTVRRLGAEVGVCLSADEKRRERYAAQMVRNAEFFKAEYAERGLPFDSAEWLRKYDLPYTEADTEREISAASEKH